MNTDTKPTAQEQFITDYLLVAYNDYKSYKYVTEKAKELNISDLAAELENDFETSISWVTSDISYREGLLIRQMLLNQGLDTWYKIAQEIKENN